MVVCKVVFHSLLIIFSFSVPSTHDTQDSRLQSCGGRGGNISFFICFYLFIWSLCLFGSNGIAFDLEKGKRSRY